MTEELDSAMQWSSLIERKCREYHLRGRIDGITIGFSLGYIVGLIAGLLLAFAFA